MTFRTLKAEEIECRVAQITETWLTLLLYKNARVDMDILDETVGAMNWKKDYQLIDGQLFCTISIWDKEKEQWISKQDVGVESFSQEEKGRASDAQKRSSVCFGIGRELYTAPSIFILPNKDMIPRGKEREFYINEKGKCETKTRFYVEYITYDENRRIKELVIRDNKNHIRYSKILPETEQEFLKISATLKQLIEEVEQKELATREEIYKRYEATSDNTMIIENMKKAIDYLKQMLEESK